MLGLAEYESGLCRCGFHRSLTADRSNYFTFESQVCPVCKGAEQHKRQQDHDDDRMTREDAAPGSPRPGDGRSTFIRRLSPSEVEERQSRRSPAAHG